MTPETGNAILSAARRFVSDRPAGYGDWVDRELGFHCAVWEASQNEWLTRQLRQFSIPIFALRLMGANRKTDWDVRTLWEHSQLRETAENPQGHQALARAIAGGDAKAARRMMLLHIFQEHDHVQSDLFCLDRS